MGTPHTTAVRGAAPGGKGGGGGPLRKSAKKKCSSKHFKWCLEQIFVFAGAENICGKRAGKESYPGPPIEMIAINILTHFTFCIA